mgnify:CR=1 FL=1
MARSPSVIEVGFGDGEIFEQLEQATLAEEVGFDGVWLTEHNFTGESVYVDPIPFAAAGRLNPMIASAAMAMSSVSVLANSLRLQQQK